MPAAPAGIAPEFSQLVADLSASPAAGNTGAAAAPVEAGSLPACALWPSLYSTLTQGAGANATAGQGLNRGESGAVVTFSPVESEVSLTDRLQSGRPPVLGARGSRSETRGAASGVRARKAQVGPLPAGADEGAATLGGSFAPQAVTVMVAAPVAALCASAGPDRLSEPESAGEGGMTSGETPASVPSPSVISGGIEPEYPGRVGNCTHRAKPAGGVVTREARSGEISGQTAIGAAPGQSAAGRAIAAQVRPIPSQQGTAEEIRSANTGRETVASTAVDQVSPSRLGSPAAGEIVGAGISRELPANQGVSASPGGSDSAADGESIRRPFQNPAPAAAFLGENVASEPSLAETVSLPSRSQKSPERETAIQPDALPFGTSRRELEVAPAGFPARELPLDSRQALRPVMDDGSSSDGRNEPMNLAGGVGAFRAAAYRATDGRPTLDANVATSEVVASSRQPLPTQEAQVRDPADAAALVDVSSSVASDEFATVRAESTRESWPTSARRFTQRAAGEKSADLAAVESLRRGFGQNANRKDFQNVTPERNEEDSKQVGTDSAKSGATMTSSAFVPRLETATPAVLAVGLPGGQKLELGVAEWSETPASGEVAGTAHKAVATVLEWVEQSAARDQHSVSLKFSLGETPLRVSVEWRAEEVRTTFHTDSAELRSALAQEWQAVAAKSPDRFDRFETPVFTSSAPASSGLGSSTSDAFARQSQSQPQHTGHESSGYRTTRGERSPATDSVTATVGGNPEPIPATSRHLHTRA